MHRFYSELTSEIKFATEVLVNTFEIVVASEACFDTRVTPKSAHTDEVCVEMW